MEQKECQEKIKVIKGQILRDIKQLITILHSTYRNLLEKLEEIDRLDVDFKQKLGTLDEEIKNYEKKNRKILKLLNKQEATQPVWTFLDDEGHFRLIDVGLLLPGSEYRENSVYQSIKNPNLLIVCNF